MKRALLLFCLLPAGILCAAQEPRMTGLFPYEGEGPFVIGPARVLAAPAFSVGFTAGALACLPVSLIRSPRAGTEGSNGKEASLVCGKWLGTALGWPVYAAGGLPFFIVKKLFWDGPRALGGLPSAAPPPPPAAPPAPP